MDTTSYSSLIQHETLAPIVNRSKVTIGPKTGGCTPEVKLNKNGDTVESIEITCRCGETIRIDCDYT
jgi:hypothetical protein